MTLDEVRNDIRTWLSDPKSKGEVPTWREHAGEIAAISPWSTLMVNGIGGTTVHYNAVSLRFQPGLFESRSKTIARHGTEAIPENSTLVDWPISYDDLEPYYDAVEYAIGVSGQAGNIGGKLISGGNRFEGPRARAYPMPALRPSGWNALMSDAAKQLGWNPFPAPAALNSVPYNGLPACTYCGFCSNNGCHNNSKGSTDINVIRTAEATGNLRIEDSARVVKIEVDGDRLVKGVTYIKDEQEHFQPARAVLLGGFVYENTRLLLISRSTAYANGLSNNHKQVGKNFFAHIYARAFGLFPGRRLNKLNGSGGQITTIEDWDDENFDSFREGFIGGIQLLAPQESKPISLAKQPPPPGVPRWGSEWKAWLRENSQALGSVNVTYSGLPYEDNVLDLDPTHRDSFGVPLVRVTHHVPPNDQRGRDFGITRGEMWLRAAGASQVWVSRSINARHPYGGTRMGTSAKDSVVDRYGFSHEVPNLGIIGASTFPTTSAHNPTLTLQALSWMTAEHLVDNWDVRRKGKLG
jgi:gluconate 2-dehydrogenase alpha chain